MFTLLALMFSLFAMVTSATATVITDDTIVLTNMPPGWEGVCEPVSSTPHCRVWRDTADARLVFMQDFRGTAYNPWGNWVGIGIVGMNPNFATITPIDVVIETRDGQQFPFRILDTTAGAEAMQFENELAKAAKVFLGLAGPIHRKMITRPGRGARLEYIGGLTAFPLDGIQGALRQLKFQVGWWLAHQPRQPQASRQPRPAPQPRTQW